MKGFDETLGAQAGHRFADDGARHPELVDEFGFRRQLVTRGQLAREDLVLQPSDHARGQRRRHRVPNSAVSLVSARI